MTTDPPSLDLVIVGGLTVDRFADGSVAPGGSVIHASRALGGSAELGIVTIAGGEPVAQSGLAELRMLVRRVVCQAAPRTIAFRHEESQSGRRMWLEPGSARIAVDRPSAERLTARAVLFAPVADEIEPGSLGAFAPAATRGAILQGWLRITGPDGEVQPRSAAALPTELRGRLADADLLVASFEDVRADGRDPQRLLDLLRRRFGGRPLLVLTDRERGAWLDAVGERWHQGVPRVVEGVPTVGAGDILAAALAARLGRDENAERIRDHVKAAMLIVAETLESRRAGRRL